MSGNRKYSTNSRLVVEEPPYLAVGTEVSAKYRGAFCEANIKSVKKLVKCKVNFENGGGNSTVADDCIIGELKVGSGVKVKVPDGQDMVGILVKITDSSSYTVVFDDGDERTLRRTSLCIKGEKHFNESETLDHLPLTDPENFGTPVMQQGKKSRKGKRSSLNLDESKGDEDMPARKKLDIKNDENEDKVVMIDFTEKKKSFLLPALLLSSTSSHSEAKGPENVVVRSFKDGKHIEVHPKDVKEFSKESAVNSTLIKGGNPSLKSAVEHAVKYLETKQLPSNWSDDGPGEIVKNESSDHSSSSEAESDGDENDRTEFLEKLTKFLGEKGTPLVRSPVLGHRDLDLYKLFKIVSKMKGMDKVESWHTVYKKMSIPIMTTTASYHIKNAYKRYLYDYEIHTRQEDDNPISKKAKKSEKSSSANTSNNTAAKSSSSNTSNNTAAKSSSSNTSNNTAAKSSGSNTSNNTAANSNQDEETLIGSDSEKDLKELPLFNDNKLPTQHKPASKRGRGRRKARSDRRKALKSPSSPGLSPLSPCSPKSISSFSASDSTGCPSPAGNYCDVRELRGKIELVLGKSNEKGLTKGDDLRDSKSDLPDKNRENDGKDSSNCKTRKLKKDKTCKDGEIVVKLQNYMANVEMNVENETEAGDGLTKEDESTCKEDTLLKEDEKQNCKNSEKKSNLKEDSVNDKEDLKKIQDGGSPVDEGGGDDPDDGGDKTVHYMDTPTDDEGQEGTDVEDAVDVVNSPSGTSETVDSDDRGERKTDNKPKKKVEGKNGAKNNDVSDDVDDLEYKLNDRIDVRYGRGRNATIYHAKITCVDPYAEERLYYLVHYQGWNARHDEWIGHARIIGRGGKQSRTRTVKEPTKITKPTPKPTAKPIPKPVAKKNGKNGAAHIGRPPGSKGTRTPSPTMNMVASGRNGNGRACKNRKDNTSEKTEPSSEVKYPARITRRNSLTLSTEMSEQDFLDQKSPDTKTESEKDSVSSPSRTPRSSKSPSPKPHIEKTSEPTAEKEEKLEDVELEESVAVEKSEEAADEKSVESSPSEMDIDCKVEVEKTLKRPREDETETSSADSPPAKKKPDDKDSSTEEVFEGDTIGSPSKETNNSEPEPTVDDTSGPDLTCSEQLPTNCASPDPYISDFPEGERFYGNGVESADAGNGSKEKDSSSSLDEGKVEKPAPSRRTKCRRDRKTRAPSSQSSIETTECHNGTSDDPTVTVMLSPSWTPKYNFTEDLDELLKNEESSERIRLLTEKIKDIRKVYGELKSELANIDRKRKRRQKRKREEELSTEENATRSPSRSSPLTTTTAVSSANTLAAVECR